MSVRTSLDTRANVRGGKFSILKLLLLLEFERWNGRYPPPADDADAAVDDDDDILLVVDWLRVEVLDDLISRCLAKDLSSQATEPIYESQW